MKLPKFSLALLLFQNLVFPTAWSMSPTSPLQRKSELATSHYRNQIIEYGRAFFSEHYPGHSIEVDRQSDLLFSALLAGDSELAIWILNRDPKLVHSRIDGYTLLHAAALGNSIDAIPTLLNLDPNLLRQKGLMEESALHLAAYAGNLQAVQLLVSLDQNLIDEKNYLAMSAIHYAALGLHQNVLQYLVSEDPGLFYEVSLHGLNILHFAAKNDIHYLNLRLKNVPSYFSALDSVMEYVKKEAPSLFHIPALYGLNPLHISLAQGSAYRQIFRSHPSWFKQKTADMSLRFIELRNWHHPEELRAMDRDLSQEISVLDQSHSEPPRTQSPWELIEEFQSLPGNYQALKRFLEHADFFLRLTHEKNDLKDMALLEQTHFDPNEIENFLKSNQHTLLDTEVILKFLSTTQKKNLIKNPTLSANLGKLIQVYQTVSRPPSLQAACFRTLTGAFSTRKDMTDTLDQLRQMKDHPIDATQVDILSRIDSSTVGEYLEKIEVKYLARNEAGVFQQLFQKLLSYFNYERNQKK